MHLLSETSNHRCHAYSFIVLHSRVSQQGTSSWCSLNSSPSWCASVAYLTTGSLWRNSTWSPH